MSERIRNSAHQWYVARGRNKLGPYEIATLRNALSKGVLLPSDVVWSPELPDWMPITEVIAAAPASVTSDYLQKAPEIKPETSPALDLHRVSAPAEREEVKGETAQAASMPKTENANVITHPIGHLSQSDVPFRPVKFRTARARDHDNKRVTLLQLQSQEGSKLTILLSREDAIQLGHTLIGDGAV
jgi:hypothetical protein